MMIIEDFDLVVLNKNTLTHLHFSTSFTSVIALALSSAQLATMCDFYVDKDAHGSDHFSVVTQIGAQICFKSKLQVFLKKRGT